MHLFGSDVSKRSLVVSSSGDKMTSSPAEMRTTAVTKPAVKTSCHGCSCREDALVNPCQNSRKPRQTTTPTQSGYLRSHQQVPTVATPTRATISDYVHGWTAVRCRIPTHPYVHGWTTPTLSGYLCAIASAHGSASQPQKFVQENTSQIKKTFPTSSPLLRRGLRKGGHNQY